MRGSRLIRDIGLVSVTRIDKITRAVRVTGVCTKRMKGFMDYSN